MSQPPVPTTQASTTEAPAGVAPATPASSDAPVVPAPADAPPVKQTERPHPLTPFIRGWLVLVAVVVGFAPRLVDNPDERASLARLGLGWILLGVLVLCLAAAAAGYVSWRFTRFVIDDEELRIETGVLFKTSRKVAFERIQSVDIIQPFAARLFGLGELRIEAGAGDSGLRLRYLSRTKAARLRDYLLARAHGSSARLADSEDALAPDVLFDAGVADTTLVTVSPQALVGSFLTSTEFLVPLLVTVFFAVLAGVTGIGVVALGGIVPMVFGVFSLVSRRVIAMFHFTLAESSRGLRVTRGLTNLTSQSVPVDRIQGVRLCQPVLWKPFGWWRVDVDIVGYGARDRENNSGEATSVLLPVASPAQVRVALSRVLPGFTVDQIPLQGVPRRARWFRWFDWWTLRYGWDDRAIVTEHGLLVHERHIVPHAKTQSVRIEQGPLQRRLGLADVHVDTPKGPVHAVARQLDAGAARELALTQLDRARAARDAAAVTADPAAETRPESPEERASADAVLAELGTDRDRFLGEGGESQVFALDDERVLRLYRGGAAPGSPVVGQVRELYGFWERARPADGYGVELPLVLDAGTSHGRVWTVDRRFVGGSLSSWLATAPLAGRRAALTSLLDAAEAVARLPLPVPGFARLVGEDAPRSYPTLVELLHAMLEGPTSRSRDHLARDVPDVGRVWDGLFRDLGQRVVAPALVHGDFCAPNVYVSPGPEDNPEGGAPRVTGVGDFSPHTLQADPLMDLTGAVAFLELEPYEGAVADSEWLLGVAVSRHGPEVARWIGVYRRYFAFYFSDTAEVEPRTYAWCLRQLDRV
ncbi:PH domain-containing protein [Microlunatus flavus]|uniref:Putative membrane protein n=1 Tax=Microlunatus flavus TaxID=1036181 RepID=A0A1H9L9G6_9ACTN|nr:PH domain-containing protein [Microlunatus flavus]SER08044.1 putative membrane protein [Microlunatus flavus]